MTATSRPVPWQRLVRRASVALLAVALLLTAAPATALSDDLPAEQTRVVVEFAPEVGRSRMAQALEAADVGLRDRVVSVPDQTVRALSLGERGRSAVVEVTSAQRTVLEADRRVAAIYDDEPVRAHAPEPDWPMVSSAALVPDDPNWTDQDGVRRLRADEVWETTTGAAGVVVAVVDTGVDANNADLRGRVVAGYDFVNDDDDPDDDNGHGTAAASLIAAAGDDATGIAGMCWRCRIMPVKVLDANGDGFLSDAAAGISWAAANGADIINVSLGASDTMPLLDAALQQAEDAGAVVVASAGNGGSTTKQWPAGADDVIAVAAVDDDDVRADYSNYGAWVDVAAPGCNPAAWVNDSLVRFCGTSSAAPLVSGAAALVLSTAPTTDAAETRDVLGRTAADVGQSLGSGIVDAYEAVNGLPTFGDTTGNVHRDNIETLAAAGVTEGCTATQFCPSQPVTRGQMASFLDRLLDLPAATVTFDDVAADHTHADAIAAVVAAGISQGCTSDRYCPSQRLSRAQMASLLTRALDLPAGEPRFDDVAASATHASGIWSVAAANITQGCTTATYCPADDVTRGQMASFLVRGFEL